MMSQTPACSNSYCFYLHCFTALLVLFLLLFVSVVTPSPSSSVVLAKEDNSPMTTLYLEIISVNKECSSCRDMQRLSSARRTVVRPTSEMVISGCLQLFQNTAVHTATRRQTLISLPLVVVVPLCKVNVIDHHTASTQGSQ